jgi:predicted MFS family arabinose efflux permease
MPSIQTTHDTALAGTPAPTLPLIGLLASGAGLAVAAIYYSQPMLGELGADIGASAGQIGLVPTLTQLGYAAGIFLLAPLGDRFDRRRIILAKAAALVVALLGAGVSPSVGPLWLASLAIGLAATMAQDIVPAAATLAPEAQRGRIVGMVMTGLLMGILLSRVISGVVASHWGWRTMFVAAGASIAAFAAVAARALPRFKPTTQLAYAALLASSAQLWRRHAALRRAALAQGLLAVGFSAFWSTLAVMLRSSTWHLGSAAAGAFGLAGAAGALIAPVAGRLADKRGPELVTRLGTGVAAASFLVMACGAWLPPQAQLWVIGLGAVGFDLGAQATLISHQTIVYGIDPGARSRLNALLFTGMFIGMSSGAALGSLALSQWGWTGVMLLAAASALAALAVRLWPSSGPVLDAVALPDATPPASA